MIQVYKRATGVSLVLESKPFPEVDWQNSSFLTEVLLT